MLEQSQITVYQKLKTKDARQTDFKATTKWTRKQTHGEEQRLWLGVGNHATHKNNARNNNETIALANRDCP